MLKYSLLKNSSSLKPSKQYHLSMIPVRATRTWEAVKRLSGFSTRSFRMMLMVSLDTLSSLKSETTSVTSHQEPYLLAYVTPISQRYFLR